MSSPPYHLRPNKAIDRLVMIEAIRRLEQIGSLADYTYYGLGGPYLEDFRVLYELCNEIGLVSIEAMDHIYKRQKFHRPCKTLDLRNLDLFEFINEYEADEEKSIFWLDYTDLEYINFEYFGLLLTKISRNSMVKVSLRADHKDYLDPETHEEFKAKFQKIMPDPDAIPPGRSLQYAKFIQDMLEVIAQRSLPGALPLMFQPINSFYYSDTNGMLTVTGVVCARNEEAKIREVFQDWKFSNFEWYNPARINVPILSTKERLLLQGKLPTSKPAGEFLLQTLGYRIEKSLSQTRNQLEQYADFHRYYPYFIRGIP